MAVMRADRWIIHADLDAFFASAEVLRRPELAGRPVLVGGSPGGRGVVASATYEARRCGVRSAMPMAQAVRLCPTAVIVHPDAAFYGMLSRQFRAVLGEFSPLVEVVSIDEAFLDVSGSERLFGRAEQLGGLLKQRVRAETGLAVSLGIASNKLVAKIASDLDKPDGLRIVSHGDEAATLGPLSVDRLPGVGPTMSARLRGAGIDTLQELADTPTAIVSHIVGSDAAHLQDRARGIDERPVRAERDPCKSLGHERTFDRDRYGITQLQEPVYRLCEKTGSDLRGRHLVTTTVALKLRYGDFTTITRQRPVPLPTDAHQDIYAAAMTLLRDALRERNSAVRLIGVRVAGLQPAVHQLDLFDQRRSRTRQLNAAIDQISARTGSGLVGPARFVFSRDVALAAPVTAGTRTIERR